MANPATPQDSLAPAAEPDQRRVRPGGRRSLGHYVAELLVVFLGVYLGFLVTDYQEELREREQKEPREREVAIPDIEQDRAAP